MEFENNEEDKNMPTMKEILKLSKDQDVYCWFCDTFMKAVVGHNVWNHRAHNESLSEVATESDKAFLLVVMENNYDRWTSEAKIPAREERRAARLPEALYTNSGSSKMEGRGSNRRFGGWSKEGCLRFNALHKLVHEDRQTRANFEAVLKEKQLTKNHTRKKEKHCDQDEEEEIFPANDIVGVRQTASYQHDSENEDESEDDDDEADLNDSVDQSEDDDDD